MSACFGQLFIFSAVIMPHKKKKRRGTGGREGGGGGGLWDKCFRVHGAEGRQSSHDTEKWAGEGKGKGRMPSKL